MNPKFPLQNPRALGICLLGAMATGAHAQLQTAGDLLVDLNFTTLTPGDLVFIPNTGTLGGGFEAIGAANTIPKIATVPNSSVKALYLDGTDFLMSVTGQTPTGGTPSRMDAPAGLVGSQPSRSVEVWVYNESVADEETVLAWGKRGGGDGTNFSCLYGSNATWGALGQWGGPDLGWSGAITPELGTWHQITWVHTGPDTEGGGALPDTTLIYVDGLLNNSENAGLLNTHPGPIQIGGQMEGDGVTPTPGVRGTMRIGRVRIHDGALTEAQVAANYALEVAGFPVTAPAPMAAMTGPIHRWSFSETEGTKVADSAGFYHGAVKGTGSTWTGTAITLPGGGSGSAPYVDLPNRLLSNQAPELNGTGEITLEMWVTNTGTQNWSRFFDFGSSSGNELPAPGGAGEGFDFLMLSATNGTNAGISRLELRQREAVGNGPAGAGGPADFQAFYDYTVVSGVERHIAVVWKDGQVAYVYEDGLRSNEIRPGDLKMVQINDVNCWLGRSNFTADAGLQGEINEFRIYDRALSTGELRQNTLDGPDATLPLPPDTDGDTLPDWFERLHSPALSHTTPAQAGLDADSDGRTNIQEFQTGTNPAAADTDGDGLNDGQEATLGTNPLLTDTDGDGLTDGAEVNTHNSSPLQVDTDSDGYTDSQEVAAGSNPNSSTSIPVIFLAARYSFDEAADAAQEGQTVPESVSGLHGYVRGTGATWTGTGLSLPGGPSATAPYVDLPNHLLSRFARANGGRGAVTLEGWVTIPSLGASSWQRVFDFGSTAPGKRLGEVFRPGRSWSGIMDGQDYFFLCGAREGNVNLRRVEWVNNDPAGTNATGGNWLVDSNASAGTLDVPLHFVVTYDEASGKMHYYENGVHISEFTSTLQLNALNDVNCWLGRSNWLQDGNLNGEFDEFRIYAGAFSATDVTKSGAKGPGTLPGGTNPATDITTLKVGNANGWPEWWVDRNPSLPASGSDTDGDGLTALQELGRGTNPAVADTDGDGLPDGVETNTGFFLSATNTGTSPLDPDTDHDGLSDAAEVAAGTDPFDIDSDDDLALDGSDADPMSAAPSSVPMAHRWPFSDLPDGAVANGTASADVVGGPSFNAIITGEGASALAGGVVLPGGANNNTTPWIDLPNGLFSSQTKVTVAGWLTLNGLSGNWGRYFDFGASNGAEVPPGGIGNGTDTLFYSYQRGADSGLQRLGFKDDPQDTGYDLGQATVLNEEIFYAVTIDSAPGNCSVYTLYRDGVFSLRAAGGFLPLSVLNDVNNWLGRSQYAGDATMNGTYNEFRIYNGILNEQAIRGLHAGGPDNNFFVTDSQVSGTQIFLTWNSRPGLTYTIESSGDLQTWTPENPNIPATGFSTQGSAAVADGRRFFRVRVD